ncbi:hypothetical protein EJB05_26419, partial [Eragrostis curvula]
MLGDLLNYALADLPVRLGWCVMYSAGARERIQILPPVLLAAGVLSMPESPRWLAMRGRDGEVHAVLARMSDIPAEADDRVEEIRNAVAAEVGGAGVWREFLLAVTGSSSSSPVIRRILVNVLALFAFQQASGIDAIVLYSPIVFKQAGISSDHAALAATVAMGVVKTLAIFVAMFLSDRVGRRPLLLASAAAIAASLTVLGVTLCINPTTPATAARCIAAVLAFVTAFSVGLGPLAPAYGSEILPLRLRAQGTSLGIAVNRLTCGILSMTFISLANTISMAGCFFLHASTAVAAWVFVYVNLEGMEVLFAK